MASDEIVLDLNVGKIPVRFSVDSTRARNKRAEEGFPQSEKTTQIFSKVHQEAVRVPGRGLEPLWIAPPDPKSGASANFATLARKRMS